MPSGVSICYGVGIGITPTIVSNGGTLIAIPNIPRHKSTDVGGVVTRTQVEHARWIGLFAGVAIDARSSPAADIAHAIWIVALRQGDGTAGVGNLAYTAQGIVQEVLRGARVGLCNSVVAVDVLVCAIIEHLG